MADSPDNQMAPKTVFTMASQFIWGEKCTNRQSKETERALSMIRGFSVLGVIVVFALGALAGPPNHQLQSGCMAVVAAAAAFAIGGVLGFLFGVPQWNPNAAAYSKDKGAHDESAESKVNKTSLDGILPNTNLVRVIDWLTTLIVGLGLVHLGTAWTYGTNISVWLTEQIISPDHSVVVSNGSAGASILLAYSVAGFFMLYFWTQRYMQGEMLASQADVETLKDELSNLQTSFKTNTTEIQEAVRSNLIEVTRDLHSAIQLTRGDLSKYKGVDLDKLPLAGIKQDIASDLLKRYSGVLTYNDEPLEHFGFQESHGRKIEAKINTTPEGWPYEAMLTVCSTDAAKPLTGEVLFLMHHTLPPRVRAVMADNGIAKLSVPTRGTFIAGAIIPGEDTRLAINLSDADGATDDFRQN